MQLCIVGFSLVRNSAVADRTDRGLSVEDGRYHRLLIENVYNVEFAIVLVSELQTFLLIQAQTENIVGKA